MKIELERVTKRYGKQTILSGFTASFISGQSYAITGANGSGKSTLLKIIAGMVTATSGTVIYTQGTLAITADEIYQHTSIAAPYLELPEELTMRELVAYHCQMRSLYLITPQDLMTSAQIDPDKEIRDYSSGMKQRLKLLLAYHTQSDILLLDEPTSNLDTQWKQWYLQLVTHDPQQRVRIICSNEPAEYSFVSECMTLDSVAVLSNLAIDEKQRDNHKGQGV
jgi:ABC-type multidrug transport system ATPase subunit